MAEITRAPVARVGVDPSKRVYQVHAVDAAGHLMLARAPPDRFFAWCTELPAGCIVAMEACGRAHHVARRYAGKQLRCRALARPRRRRRRWSPALAGSAPGSAWRPARTPPVARSGSGDDQTRRRRPAHLADPERRVGRDERGQTQRPHQPLAGAIGRCAACPFALASEFIVRLRSMNTNTVYQEGNL